MLIPRMPEIFLTQLLSDISSPYLCFLTLLITYLQLHEW